MPTGAMNVARCFSAASIIIVKTSSAVQRASMKRPWAVEVPTARVVRTLKVVGNRTETM